MVLEGVAYLLRRWLSLVSEEEMTRVRDVVSLSEMWPARTGSRCYELQAPERRRRGC